MVYAPLVTGSLTLVIMHGRQHVQGSPFTVTVDAPCAFSNESRVISSRAQVSSISPRMTKGRFCASLANMSAEEASFSRISKSHSR